MEDLTTDTEEKPKRMAYAAFNAAAEAISKTVVVLCPDENCSRTATIESCEDGTRVIRRHAEGKKDALAQVLIRLGQVRHEPCPHHDNETLKFTDVTALSIGNQALRTIRGVLDITERKRRKDLPSQRPINSF